MITREIQIGRKCWASVECTLYLLVYYSTTFKIAKTICKKYRRAVVESAEAVVAFEGLRDAAPPATLKQWEVEITEAESKRSEDITAMSKVMKNRVTKGNSIHFELF